jgi:hypothetical protein
MDLMNSEVHKVRAQRVGAPSREVAKSRGAKTTVGSRVNGRTVGSRTPSLITYSGVRRLKRVSLSTVRNRKVLRAEAQRDTWKNHKVGPGNRQVNTCLLEKGVNTH